MLARDIMTRDIITLEPMTTICDAVDILVKNKISGAPVIDGEGKLIGIVTEKDLLISLDFLGEKDALLTPVNDFMSNEIISFSEETPIKDIMKVLVARNIKRVPILKGDDLVGIVSRRDILKGLCLKMR